MNPIHGERGKFYYAVKCQNENCKENLYVLEIEKGSTESAKDSVVGKMFRCSTCTEETLIESRRMVTIEVR